MNLKLIFIIGLFVFMVGCNSVKEELKCEQYGKSEEVIMIDKATYENETIRDYLCYSKFIYDNNLNPETKVICETKYLQDMDIDRPLVSLMCSCHYCIEDIKTETEEKVINETKPLEQTSFENKQYSKKGIKIKYPSDWEIIESDVLGFFVSFSPPSERFVGLGINIDNTYDTLMTLEKYTNKRMSTINSQFLGEILVQEETVLANNPAFKIIYTENDRDIFQGDKYIVDLKITTYYIVRGEIAYSIRYSAEIDKYEGYIDEIEEMIQTLEIE
ncbi:hypothetical protein KY347_03505 [Candidatus Woesearchaeota archaeon]|nr:hypothetical protein [Candidatus Woesearchaeota archaeon]